MSNRKIKTRALPVPSTREHAEELLASIGRLQRQVSNIENSMNDELAAVKQNYEQQAQPLNDEIEECFASLHAYAEAHRDELLKGRAKTAKMAAGELSWRTTPPRVSLRNQGVVMETLKRLDMSDLIRTKEEINKDAILSDPSRVEGIQGITVTQREEFVVKPYESEIEKVETVNKKAA